MRASPDTFIRARRLRQEMTLPEVLLWRELRRKKVEGLRFRRQHPMEHCVLDFYLPSARLAVEVDGLAHDLGDNLRETHVAMPGWLVALVLRVLAADVLDEERREAVLRMIADEVRHRPPAASLRSAPPP